MRKFSGKEVSLLMGLLLGMTLWAVCGSVYAATVPQIYFINNQHDGLDGPTRVSMGSGVYVTDTSWGEVAVLDPTGNRVGTIKEPGVPRGVKVLANGNILIGFSSEAGGSVSLYSSSGSLLRRLGDGIGQFSLPSAMAVDPSTGRIYVVDSVRHLVYMFDAAGAALGYFGGYGFNNDQFDFPAGIAFDEVRKEVLVADQGNFRVKVFDPAGNFLRSFGSNAPDSSFMFSDTIPDLLGKFSKIQGLTVDGQSRVYIVDSFQCAVQVFDSATGEPLKAFGDYGSGNGELKTPTDVAYDGQNRLVVADWNNNRLAFFQIDGTPPTPSPPPSPVNTAPTSPVPVFPTNNAVIGGLSFTLITSNATDTEGNTLQYVFQADTGSGFNTSNLVSATVPQGTSFTTAIVTVPIDHAMYFWRVKAVETSTADKLESPWSALSFFYVNASNRAPSAPTNLLPASGTSVKPADTLSWSASTDPDLYDSVTYTVEISSQSTFAAILEAKSGITSTSVGVSQFSTLTSGTYYWRVRAVDNRNAASANSAASSFSFGATSIQVSTTPAGATVWLDGNYGYPGTKKGTTGATPLSLDVQPGRHVVRIQMAGYFEFYGTYNVSAGQAQAVNVTLTPRSSYSFVDRGDMTASNGIRIGSSGVSITYSAPFAVDWNNDGRKDLLVGDYTGAVYLFINIGTDAAPSMAYAGMVVNTGNGAVPFVVDWNNDGKKDLLAGTRSGTVLLYLNTAADAAPAFGAGQLVLANGATLSVGTWAAPAVVDWNNDGRKDLIIGTGSGYVRRYMNVGTDIAPAFGSYSNLTVGSSTLTVSGPAVPVVFDWNSDGKKDLIVGSKQGVYLYTNTGTDAAPAFSSKSNMPSSSSSMSSMPYAAPFLVDWNNDAIYELLVGNQGGTIRYYTK